MTELWETAAQDVEAENRLRSMTAARMDSEGTWRWMALARSEGEYEARKEMALDKLLAVANKHDADIDLLVAAYDRQFKLLVEAAQYVAKDDDDDDDDDTDDDSDATKDKKGGVTPADNFKSDDDSDDDDSDDSDSDSDESDDESDDTGSEDTFAAGNPFDKNASLDPFEKKYASLLKRIAGEFSNVPAGAASGGGAGGAGAPAPAGGAMPPAGAGAQEPAAMGTDPMAQMNPAGAGGMAGEAAGAGMAPPMASHAARVAMIAEEVGAANPNLPFGEIMRLAKAAAKASMSREAMDPLIFGDREPVGDEALTRGVKDAAPADLRGIDRRRDHAVPLPTESHGVPGAGGVDGEHEDNPRRAEGKAL